MTVVIRNKGWIWKLGFFIGAHRTFTTIGTTIWKPKEAELGPAVLRHEMIHVEQQRSVGLMKFILLYVFCLPVFWNPWRAQWEREAGASDDELRSRTYGWLRV